MNTTQGKTSNPNREWHVVAKDGDLRRTEAGRFALGVTIMHGPDEVADADCILTGAAVEQVSKSISNLLIEPAPSADTARSRRDSLHG